MDVDGVPADIPGEVGDLRRGRDHRRLVRRTSPACATPSERRRAPQAAAAGAAASRAGARTPPGRRRAQRRRRRRAPRSRAPAAHSAQPTATARRSLTATRTTVAICHAGIRCVHSLVVAAGTHEQRGSEQGARRGEDRHGPKRDQSQEDQIRKDSGYAERPGALGVESRRQPTAAEQQVRRQNNHAESAGEDQVARLQHEQAPEQERLDVRPRMKTSEARITPSASAPTSARAVRLS